MKTSAPAHVYQMRLPESLHPTDVIGEVTHAVWRVVSSRRSTADPHLWPSLYNAFLNLFREHLVAYPGCGEREMCRGHFPLVLASSPGAERVHDASKGFAFYSLEINRPIDDFVDTLARVGARIFSESDSKTIHSEVLKAIRNTLAEYMIHNPACLGCSARQGFQDRRVLCHPDGVV